MKTRENTDSGNHVRYPALKYPDFRNFWLGSFVSNIGSMMQMTALNWHIYLLTHSAFALGIIGLTRFIPIVCFTENKWGSCR